MPPMKKPSRKIVRFIPLTKTPSSFLRGFRFMIPGSAGSMPKARAGKLSVTRFTHRIWIASNGTGNWNKIAKRDWENLPDIAGKQKINGLSNVFENNPAFPNRSDDGREIIVRQYHLRGALGHIRPEIPSPSRYRLVLAPERHWRRRRSWPPHVLYFWKYWRSSPCAGGGPGIYRNLFDLAG